MCALFLFLPLLCWSGPSRCLSGKESACRCRQEVQEMWVRSLDQEDPLEENTPVFLAWKIPWTEEPDGLHSLGSQRVRHDRKWKIPNTYYTRVEPLIQITKILINVYLVRQRAPGKYSLFLLVLLPFPPKIHEIVESSIPWGKKISTKKWKSLPYSPRKRLEVNSSFATSSIANHVGNSRVDGLKDYFRGASPGCFLKDIKHHIEPFRC